MRMSDKRVVYYSQKYRGQVRFLEPGDSLVVTLAISVGYSGDVAVYVRDPDYEDAEAVVGFGDKLLAREGKPVADALLPLVHTGSRLVKPDELVYRG